MSSDGSNFSRLTEATYRVEVRNRLTGNIVSGCQLHDTKASFTRTLDGISKADIEISTKGCSACDCLPVERRDELVFIRDDWDEPAWVGPILRSVDDSALGTRRIVAEDRLWWWQGTAALRDIAHLAPKEIDAVQAFAELISQAEQFQPSLLDYWFKSELRKLPPLAEVDIEVDVAENESLWSVMAGIAKTLVDYTVVGPHLYWGSPEVPVSDGPCLTGDMWVSPPAIDRDASGVISQVQVIGAGGITGVYPPTPADSIFGKKTEFVSDTNLNSQSEVDAAAQEIYTQNSTPSDFVITGDGSMSPNFPLPLHELIPGRNFPIKIEGACLSTEDFLQLTNVVVELQSIAGPSRRWKETRVALDFARPGTAGSAERASG